MPSVKELLKLTDTCPPTIFGGKFFFQFWEGFNFEVEIFIHVEDTLGTSQVWVPVG